ADAKRQCVAGIDDTVFLQRGNAIGQQFVGHLRVLLFDQRVGGAVIAIQVIVPADDRCIDEALHQIRFFVDQFAPRLYQRRIGGKSLVGEQKNLRGEIRGFGNGERLRGYVALHRAFFVGEKRLRVEGVGPQLRIGKAKVGLEPLVKRRYALVGNEQRKLFQVGEFIDALVRMRDQHLRVLLKQRSHFDRRNLLLDRVEGLQRIGAQKKIDFADRQQDAVVDARPARHDGDVEAIFAISAVRQRLVEAAVLAFGDPIGAERNLIKRLRCRRRDRRTGQRESDRSNPKRSR